MATIATLTKERLAPGKSGKAYAIQSFGGENIYIPCSNSAMRLVVTGKETDNAFAVITTGGAYGPPVGFHYHREAHDVFLCLQGSINVWANDKCRTMEGGDFASVPPGVVHQFQILGTHTEFIGLIVPGGWEEFFRYIGEPNAGPMWPQNETRNPFEVLIPKLKEAAEKFDMVPQPQHPKFDPQPWEETDIKLSGSLAPYFLRANKGPAFAADGWVVRPLATTKESDGRFAMASLEGSSVHENKAIKSSLTFTDVHHAFHVVAGEITFVVDDEATTLTSGETIYVPKGSKLSIQFASLFAKTYIFANGGGLVELLQEAGESWTLPMIPEKELPSSIDKLGSLAKKHNCTIVA